MVLYKDNEIADIKKLIKDTNLTAKYQRKGLQYYQKDYIQQRQLRNMKNNLKNQELEHQLENLPPIQTEKPVWNAGALNTNNRKFKYAESLKKELRGKSTNQLPSS